MEDPDVIRDIFVAKDEDMGSGISSVLMMRFRVSFDELTSKVLHSGEDDLYGSCRDWFAEVSAARKLMVKSLMGVGRYMISEMMESVELLMEIPSGEACLNGAYPLPLFQ